MGKENLRQPNQKELAPPFHITLPRDQVAALLEIFAQRFLTPDSSLRPTVQPNVLNAAKALSNTQVCPEIRDLEEIDPTNFLCSLSHYQPPNELGPSPLGSGSKGREVAEILHGLSREFETWVLNNINFPDSEEKFEKLPLELQLILAGSGDNDKLKGLIDKGGLLLFVKRKKIPREIVDIIYQLSLYTGRRLDWLDDLFSSEENGNIFPVDKHFGRLVPKEKKEIYELLRQLEEITHSFFQLIPVDHSGIIDPLLEDEINSPSQEMEESYRNLLIKQADLDEELKTLRLAFLSSIPVFFAIDQLLEAHPILARIIPPAFADILTLWAETSPFINRNLPPKERIIEFTRLVKERYKTSMITSLIFSILGSQLVNQLENANKLIAAGFAYAFVPFVGALITTYQSFLQEYKRGKELREKMVNGYVGLKDSQLSMESLLKTVKHPARLYLLLAGFLGVGEGIILGALNLIENPLALTYVGELNESVLTTIGLSLHLKLQWLKYHRYLKSLTRSVLDKDGPCK